VNSEHTLFLEIVQDSLKQTFQLASTAPSAELHKAKKSIDFKNSRADEIISKL